MCQYTSSRAIDNASDRSPRVNGTLSSPPLFRKKEKKNSSIDSDRLLYTVLSPVTAAAVGTNVHIGLGYRRRNGGGFSKCWLS